MMGENKLWIGFDLGGTKMLSGAFDGQLDWLAREKRKTRAAEGVDSVVKRILSVIEKTIEKSGQSSKQLQGVGIGVPGTIDLQKGVVLEAPNLGWEKVPLKQCIQDHFNCPVTLCNDVDSGLFGEYALGSAQGAHSVVGIFPGTGVGGACVIEGKLLQGRRRTAMEIGHVPFGNGGPLDGAGKPGTLETVASRLAISAAAAQAAFRGAAPALNSMSGTDLSEIRSGVLAKAIAQGDVAVETIVQHAAKSIGKAAVALIHLFSPDLIILGGGL
ncbi:MAG: ROK family protein, partial [Planctomycetota bacterium]|nr:ROK family protein [Planctomycetota bacterium]